MWRHCHRDLDSHGCLWQGIDAGDTYHHGEPGSTADDDCSFQYHGSLWIGTLTEHDTLYQWPGRRVSAQRDLQSFYFLGYSARVWRHCHRDLDSHGCLWQGIDAGDTYHHGEPGSTADDDCSFGYHGSLWIGTLTEHDTLYQWPGRRVSAQRDLQSFYFLGYSARVWRHCHRDLDSHGCLWQGIDAGDTYHHGEPGSTADDDCSFGYHGSLWIGTLTEHDTLYQWPGRRVSAQRDL